MLSTKLRFIDPKAVRFWVAEDSAHLRAEIKDDQCIRHAILRRAFPMSGAKGYISLQSSDGKEVAILPHLEGLDEESRRAADAELDRRYFTPKISAIVFLKLEGGIWTFEVETQRGRARFYVRNWRDSAHEIGFHRWQINSVDGQRFEIPDSSKLDARSQSLLEQVF